MAGAILGLGLEPWDYGGSAVHAWVPRWRVQGKLDPTVLYAKPAAIFAVKCARILISYRQWQWPPRVSISGHALHAKKSGLHMGPCRALWRCTNCQHHHDPSAIDESESSSGRARRKFMRSGDITTEGAVGKSSIAWAISRRSAPVPATERVVESVGRPTPKSHLLGMGWPRIVGSGRCRLLRANAVDPVLLFN